MGPRPAKYTKKELHEHVLLRPSIYVGSVAPVDREGELVWTEGTATPAPAGVTWSPALEKVFDEILTNAVDHTPPKKRIDVSLGEEIKVTSQSHLPVRQEGEETPVPTLIFGTLLSGSNFDDAEDRVVAGQNGLGAKLANIFSTRFSVRVKDAVAGKKFEQTWADNMTKVGAPKETSFSGKTSSVEVAFVPDVSKLGPAPLWAFRALARRVVDAAATCEAKVFLEGAELKVTNMQAYAKIFGSGGEHVHARVGHWDVALGLSAGSFAQVSFVNGCRTTRGGAHVDQCVTAVVDELAKQKGVPKVPKHAIRNALEAFVSVKGVVRPQFNNQMKECLTSRPSERFAPPAALVKRLAALLHERLQDLASEADRKLAKKNDGAKSSKIRGIPQLDDAAWAGTAKSDQCTLIVTEGLSAKTLAISGLAIVGRERFGVFPLKGKGLNVTRASTAAAAQNAEFSALKKILGLKADHVYADTKGLRYGSLMVLADQDNDGKHFCGLVINMIYEFWPSLLEIGFVRQMVTPLVVADGRRFFSQHVFEAWAQEARPKKVKYFKGLGTSTAEEARQYFREINRLTCIFKATDGDDAGAMQLAFSQDGAEARKRWILEAPMDLQGVAYGEVRTCPLAEFIHKEFLQFSLADVKRSIPRLEDGLKPSQRKILYACILRGERQGEIKVAQMAAFAAERTFYHHGEASLQSAIVNMAQNYMGSNNVNLLEPLGQFGTRLAQGHDAASPRYIFTKLAPVTRHIFPAADDGLLTRVVEDGGHLAEPVTYMPIVPMVLVNGARGIGTGFSTHVPPHSLADVVRAVRAWIEGRELPDLVPSFRGFKGTVVAVGNGKFEARGVFSREEGGSLRITELPPYRSTSPRPHSTASFVEVLDRLVEKGIISDYANHSTDETVNFVVRGYRGSDPWSDFVLVEKGVTTTNMHLITDGGIVKFDSAHAILAAFCERRLALYEQRKETQAVDLRASIARERVFLAWIALVTKNRAILSTPMEEVELSPDVFPAAMHAELWSLPLKEFNKSGEERRKARVERLEADLRAVEASDVRQTWLGELDALE